jgi:NAD(P)-dependent dehydrogenase (short-subunit alcohol dehydrogenase family)
MSPGVPPVSRRPVASPSRKRVADLVLLLASDRAANLTGADLAIDGGLITTL